MSNYKNRRARGQCASCTNPALPDGVRCQQCKDKTLAYRKANREQINAKRREKYYQETLEREQRLDDINERLKAEIAELDKANGNQRTN